MTDARRYAVWPDPRSMGFWSSKNSHFQVCLLRHLQRELANDHKLLNYSTISKFHLAGFLKLELLFLSRDFELGRVPAVSHYRKTFLISINLVCRYRSMTDARRYAVWLDPSSSSSSRSRGFWSSENCTFPTLSPPPFTMAAGKWPLIRKLQHNIYIWPGRIFFTFVLVLGSRAVSLSTKVFPISMKSGM